MRTAVSDLGGIWKKANGVEKIHSVKELTKSLDCGFVVAFCLLGISLLCCALWVLNSML